MRTEDMRAAQPAVVWFDGFTKVVLSVMFIFLTFIFISAKYMNDHKMEGGGTDDTVNRMASTAADAKAHPFIDLPGDAQVGAFSIANFCVGLIVGHLWSELFGRNAAGKGTPQPLDTSETPVLQAENEAENKWT